MRDSLFSLPGGLKTLQEDLAQVGFGDHQALAAIWRSRADATLRICTESRADSQARVSQAEPHVRDVLRNAGEHGVNVTALEVLLKRAKWPDTQVVTDLLKGMLMIGPLPVTGV